MMLPEPVVPVESMSVVREERIGNARLILGDMRQIAPSIATDVIVTDPVWPNAPRDTVPGSNDPWGLWREAVEAFPSHDRAVIVMRSDSDPRFLAEYKANKFFRIMHLPYVMPGYLGRALGGDEYAYWFGSVVASVAGRRVIPGRGPAAQPSHRPANGHPMSRAQVHFNWLIDWCVDPGESVFDPFMGSGTTGVACALLGVPFTGIEIHEPFFDIACRRIEAAQRQADLFVAPPAAPQPATGELFA